MKHSTRRPSAPAARGRPPSKSRRFDGKPAGASSEKRFYTAKPKAPRFDEESGERRESPARGKPRRFDSKPAYAPAEKRSYSVKPKPRFDDGDEERRSVPDDFRKKSFPPRDGFKDKKRFSDKKKPFGADRSAFRPDRKSFDATERPARPYSPEGGFKDKKRFPDKKKAFRPDARMDRAPSLSAADKPGNDNDVLWGLHAVRAAWLNQKRRCFRLWLTEAGQKTFAATLAEGEQELLKRPTFKVMERHDLDQIAPPGSVHQGIVLEAGPLHEPTLHDVISGDNPADVLIMLDQVTDPHNVGAILRSASALGASAVIMTERNAPNTTGVLAKSASGAVEYVPQIHVVNLARTLDDLQQAGYWCVGLAEEGEKDLGELDLSSRIVLVLGAEGDGLRHLTRKKCNELARLPTGGAVGSLNVSNAAAVALYETRRQKSKFNK